MRRVSGRIPEDKIGEQVLSGKADWGSRMASAGGLYLDELAKHI
jgi:hypothetical protein